MNIWLALYRILFDFPFQLIIAANLFAFSLPKRTYFWLREIIVFVPMMVVYDVCVMTFGYNILENPLLDKSIMMVPILYVVLGIRFCYRCSMDKAAFCTASAHPAQNMIYSLFKLAKNRLDFPPDSLTALCFYGIMLVAIYAAVYYFFCRWLKEANGYEVLQGRLLFNANIVMLYVVYLYGMIPDDTAAVLILFIICDVLALVMQFGLFSESTLNMKYSVTEQLLHAERKKYQQINETTEIINRKCHDLKYLIAGLREMEDGPELKSYFNEIEEAATIYESAVRSGNEALDLLLMDKMLYCEKHHIKLTCVADGSQLRWMDTMDLRILFGNALDNAIESVSSETDENNRIISFRVSTTGEMVSIHFENYVGHEVVMDKGWPVTSKKDTRYHGFGLLSIRRIVEKYGGTISIRVENHVFRLNVLLPKA